MGSISVRHRKILEELVHDCILYGLNEHESLEYIKKRNGGMKLSRSSFYLIKKRVEQNESNLVEKRLTHYGRVGFAVDHLKQIDEIRALNKVLFRMIIDESSKPVESRNVFAISRLAASILENEGALRVLNLDTPMVKQLKEEISKAKEYKRIADSIQSKVTYHEPPSSALIIPPNSIAGRMPDITPEEKQRDEPVFE